MSRFGEDSRYKIWLQQGYFDIQAAKESLKAKNYEWTCYQAVQAVEKILKSVLINAGWKPPMTHKLGVLVGLCNRANSVFTNVKFNYRRLEAYTFISRYPFVYPSQGGNSKKTKGLTPHEYINREDAETALNIAIDVFEKVHEFLNNRSDYPREIINIEEFYFSAIEVDERIKNIIEKVTQADKISAQKIILFGGFSREKERPRTSTMDLIIVGETNLTFIERIEYIRELTKGAEPIVEPLIYTKQEFNYMLDEEGEGFLETAIEEGKVIWEIKPYNSLNIRPLN